MKKTRFFSVLTSAAALAFACTGISASAVETTISVPDDTSIVTEETNLEDMNLSDLVSMLGSASENSTAETTVSDENATSDDFTSDFYDTNGNATLIQSEKILYDSEEMQFISVTTKDGHVFYVLINYSAESGEDNVYFLNKERNHDTHTQPHCLPCHWRCRDPDCPAVDPIFPAHRHAPAEMFCPHHRHRSSLPPATQGQRLWYIDRTGGGISGGR